MGFKSIHEISRLSLTDPDFKGAVQVINEAKRLQMIATNGSIFRRYLQQRIAVEMLCLEFSTDTLVDAFDEKIQQLVTGGFVSFFERQNIESCKPKRFEQFYDERGPKVLSVKNLEAGFVVWIVTVLFAMCSFVGEWILTFFEYLLIKQVFTAYYNAMISNAWRF